MVVLMRKIGNTIRANGVSSTVCMRDGSDSSPKTIRIITVRRGLRNKKVKHWRSEQSANS